MTSQKTIHTVPYIKCRIGENNTYFMLSEKSSAKYAQMVSDQILKLHRQFTIDCQWFYFTGKYSIPCPYLSIRSVISIYLHRLLDRNMQKEV